MIKVRIELTNDTPLGVSTGKTKWLAWLEDSAGHPFRGCPLGRSTAGEEAAIRDLIRPGYAVPADHYISLADVEVIARKDKRAYVYALSADEAALWDAGREDFRRAMVGQVERHALAAGMPSWWVTFRGKWLAGGSLGAR